MTTETRPDTVAVYQEMARRYIEEVWDKNNAATEAELLAPDWVDHMPLPGCPQGPAGHRAAVQLMHDAFPDLRFFLDDVAIMGDKVVDRWTATGTFLGELYGFPGNGERMIMTGLDFHVVRSGRFAELWHEESTASMVEQLGMAPKPGSGPGAIVGLTVGNIFRVAKYRIRGRR
ncbi:ester cyclase [Streptomyces kaniharaensis]|uniref:Ester cyclase n=1 Tax=Streptomyces kaniharaensis TaxID=212423 RepID=A0A6N7KZ51_9ACTN|nr:ester cyclase [Streptomyces kaniharaensis]MQS15538.1 ester cyclase [Streptomyces kaniharaensis]